jgi:primosomal protein N' (replication factor Y)
VRVRVAVPVPRLDALTYDVPPVLGVPALGARVRVPLGGRTITGVVCAHEADNGDASDAVVAGAAIKAIREILDPEPFIPAEVMRVAEWASTYYLSGLGEVLAAALPPAARSARVDAHKTVRLVEITEEGRSYVERSAERPRLSAAQLRGLGLLAVSDLSVAHLAQQGISGAVVTRLVSKGLASIRLQRVERSPFRDRVFAGVTTSPRALTTEQSSVLEAMAAWTTTPAFRVALLHGVTGSGKSELYLRLADRVLAEQRRVLVLVPEIGLTSAMAELFRVAFGDRVAVQHSGLSAGERHDQWHRIRDGSVDVVIGTRSAVFAPLTDLGLIVVDEEHDASYKQDESPRYHGRDLAIVRGQCAGALVVLGSATPSLESYRHATTGKYALLTLQRRVLDRPLAQVEIVDMRAEYAREGPDVVLSQALRNGLLARVASGEQAMVLLNRRGLATTVVCRQCTATIECPRCSVSLVVHGGRSGRRLRCHYCDWSVPVPGACAACGGVYLELTGFGTERVEEEIRALLPGARVARVDRDTVARKGALDDRLRAFARRELDVLVGTQMIAKGHDFPAVTLVGVVSADVGLGVADFRAAERTFQLLTQVAGRAGRGDQRGTAIVQTLYPHHYSIEFACQQNYGAFVHRELSFRRDMGYPPFVALVNIVIRAKSEGLALAHAADLGA